MAERIVVGAAVLPTTSDTLRAEVTTLRRSLDDLDGFLRELSDAWTGTAASAFGQAYASWSGASDAVHTDLAELADLVDLADRNLAAATRAGLRAWGTAPSHAVAGSVVAMAAGGAGPGTVTVSEPDLAAGATAVAATQTALAGAARSLAIPPGIAGDDADLAAWRARYDALTTRALAAVHASTTVLAGVAEGLTETSNVFTAADATSAPGAPSRTPLPRPVVADVPALAAAPSTGPGPLGAVPDALAEYVPDVDPATLDAAADQWRRLGQAMIRELFDADGAMTRVLTTNTGPVFAAMRRYWATVYVPCGPDTLLDLAARTPGSLAGHLETLADVVRRTQCEIEGAIEQSTPHGFTEAGWKTVQVVKTGESFLGRVGRVGAVLVDIEALTLRAGIARQNYLREVDQATAAFDRSLEARLDHVVGSVRRVGDVSADLVGAPAGTASSFPPLTIDRKQIEKKYGHASDFGVSLPRGRAGFDAFEHEIQSLMRSLDSRRTNITYRGEPAIISYDVKTARAVLQNPDGSFLSAWRLSEAQLFNVMHRYTLGGS